MTTTAPPWEIKPINLGSWREDSHTRTQQTVLRSERLEPAVKKSVLAKYLAPAVRTASPELAVDPGSSKAAMTAEDITSPALARFPGSKGGAGVWQRIISEMPPHELYVEAFAGKAQVLLKKRPAVATIAIESDAAVCSALRSVLAKSGEAAGVTVVCANAVAWLEKHRGKFNERTVVYCDPPYLFEVRSNPRRRYYGHEFGEEWLHGELLAVLSRLTTQRVSVLISGYRSRLYDHMLSCWRRIDYHTMTRGAKAVTESLWCNFEPPAQLHDYRFLAVPSSSPTAAMRTANFRERERLKRKKARWLAKLRKMTPLEAAAVLAALDEWRRQPSSEPALVDVV